MSLAALRAFPAGFEENDALRSSFMRGLALLPQPEPAQRDICENSAADIPRTLVRYWHDASEIPGDVQACLASWDVLEREGFSLRMFDDLSAAAYIAAAYGAREQAAFSRCRHPAMRSDYFRLCFILSEGGLYVDADDVLIAAGWKTVFNTPDLKVQPLCYDMTMNAMAPASDIWRPDRPSEGRIFYVNNNPIAASPGHPILARAVRRATERLLGSDPRPEIQSTTGPGNLTAAIAAHAHGLMLSGRPFDFDLLRDWDATAETRWDLSYRSDGRNWRNMDD